MNGVDDKAEGLIGGKGEPAGSLVDLEPVGLGAVSVFDREIMLQIAQREKPAHVVARSAQDERLAALGLEFMDGQENIEARGIDVGDGGEIEADGGLSLTDGLDEGIFDPRARFAVEIA
jgi:hypothetical protein